MSGDLIELDAHRPHFVIPCECGEEFHGVAVVPQQWLQRIAAGDPSVEPLPPCLLRAIVGSWVRLMDHFGEKIS